MPSACMQLDSTRAALEQLADGAWFEWYLLARGPASRLLRAGQIEGSFPWPDGDVFMYRITPAGREALQRMRLRGRPRLRPDRR